MQNRQKPCVVSECSRGAPQKTICTLYRSPLSSRLSTPDSNRCICRAETGQGATIYGRPFRVSSTKPRRSQPPSRRPRLPHRVPPTEVPRWRSAVRSQLQNSPDYFIGARRAPGHRPAASIASRDSKNRRARAIPSVRWSTSRETIAPMIDRSRSSSTSPRRRCQASSGCNNAPGP